VQLTDAGIKHLVDGCERLQVLKLAHKTHLTDKSMFYVARCITLDTLLMECLPNITDRGIQTLSLGMSKVLKYLKISDCARLSQQVYSSLENFKCLKWHSVSLMDDWLHRQDHEPYY